MLLQISRKRKRRVRNLKVKPVKEKKAVGENGSLSGRRRKHPTNTLYYLVKKALLAPFLFFRN